jgi:hypothetical protein
MQYRTWQLCTVAVTVAVTSHVSTAVLFQLSIQCAMIVFILHRYLIDWHSMSAAASVHQISMAKRSVRDDLDDQEEAAFDAAILINDKLTGILPVDVTKKQKVDSKQIIRPVSSPLRSAPECNVMSALSGALCSNCKRRPVAAVTNCFADWCHQCDVSLWATRSSVECDSSSSSIHHSLSVEIHPSLSDPESGNLAVDLNGSRLRSQSVEHARAIVGISPHLYGYYQRAEFIALGQPLVKAHMHPAGLSELQFENCFVKVRVGHDLEQLMRCSKTGSVAMWNLTTNGWASNGTSMLPSFIFVKYISSYLLSTTI